MAAGLRVMLSGGVMCREWGPSGLLQLTHFAYRLAATRYPARLSPHPTFSSLAGKILTMPLCGIQ